MSVFQAVAAVIDDVVEGFENSVRQPVLPHELPDIFLAGHQLNRKTDVQQSSPELRLTGEHRMSEDPTVQRLDDQIEWYEKCSAQSQRLFKSLKVVVIAAAALIPFLAGIATVPAWVTGALGMLIAITEGVQQLNQYHANWNSYRSTCEALKHEKYLYLGKAGPYAAAKDPHGLLAKRIESLVSQEHAKWASGQENIEKVKAERVRSG